MQKQQFLMPTCWWLDKAFKSMVPLPTINEKHCKLEKTFTANASYNQRHLPVVVVSASSCSLALFLL